MSNDLITFNPEQLALIKTQIAAECTDGELQLFLAVAQRTGLDPFSRQIYCVKRKGKMTIQTSIDGYRLIADRSGKYAGGDEAIYTHDDENYVIKAVFTVHKLMDGVRYPFVGVAHWSEYCPLDKEGNPEFMWKKMPYTMLAKCAEAQALRRAFPADLSGIYTTEEMAQAGEAEVVKLKRNAIEAPATTKVALKALETKPAVFTAVDGEYGFEDMITKGQLAKIGELLKACKFSPAQKSQWQAMMRTDYHAESAKDLTCANAEIIINDLNAIAHSDALDQVTEMAKNA